MQRTSRSEPSKEEDCVGVDRDVGGRNSKFMTQRLNNTEQVQRSEHNSIRLKPQKSWKKGKKCDSSSK